MTAARETATPPPRRGAKLVFGPLQRVRRLRRSRHGAVAPHLPPPDEAELFQQIGRLLSHADTGSQRGEATLVAVAYVELDGLGRERFLRAVANGFGVDHRAVDAAAEAWRSAEGHDGMIAAADALRRATTPGYTRLLHLFTGLESGVKLLVDLRAELRTLDLSEPDLATLDQELARFLGILFDVGLLDLRRISWDSPAALLEKLIAYEAVHAIASWTDLKNRLASDRRCYAFFHPAMPDEPLIFVEIALTQGMASHLALLLDEDAPLLDADAATAATFYSITNCQPGLAGVNLGTELIEGVVERLSHELPSLTIYATLSPIPGFRAWAEEIMADDELLPRERALLPPVGRLRDLLADEAWANNAAASGVLEPGLTRLCARYLTTVRPDGRVMDPVGNFHLSNGAAIERVNWLANSSSSGLAASYGLMVNYRYDPERIASRAAAYATDRTLAVADGVQGLTR